MHNCEVAVAPVERTYHAGFRAHFVFFIQAEYLLVMLHGLAAETGLDARLGETEQQFEVLAALWVGGESPLEPFKKVALAPSQRK